MSSGKFKIRRPKKKAPYRFFMTGKNREMPKHEDDGSLPSAPKDMDLAADNLIPVAAEPEYVATSIIVNCTSCKQMFTLDVHINKLHIIEKTFQERKIVKALCPVCKRETECVPIPKSHLSGYPGLEWLAETEDKAVAEFNKQVNKDNGSSKKTEGGIIIP